MEIQGSGTMYAYDNPLSDSKNIAPWYEHRTLIKSVVFDDAVRSVGDWAFAFCPNLTEVHLGASMEHIDSSAFDHSGLEKIHFNEQLTEIRDNAFSGTNLTEVTFPESLRYVGNLAFEHCPLLKSVRISSEKTRFAFDTWQRLIFSDENGEVPAEFCIYGATNSVVEEYAQIMGYSFQGKTKGDWEAKGKCGKNAVWYLDLDSGFLKIAGTGDMDHYNGSWQLDPQNESQPDPKRTMAPWEKYREQIYSVSIHDGITSIGENAFESCFNLQDVHWGSTVRSIGFQSFLGTALDTVVLPDSITELNQFAFNWCSSLKHVELPESFKKLQACVFASCQNLESVVLGSKTEIEYSQKFGTPFNHQEGPNEQERWLPQNMTIYSLPNSPAEEFAEKYNIPFVVGARGMKADYEGQCGNNVWWFIDENQRTLVLYGTNKTWIYNVPADEQYWPESDVRAYRALKKAGELFTTPPDFYYHRAKFDKLVILPGVTRISENLFQNLPIREADLGTVEEIGLGAFSGTSLERIDIPETVKLIRGWNFADCQELRDVTIPGKTRMELTIFRNTPKLRFVTFGKDVKIQDDEYGDLFNDYQREEQIPHGRAVVFLVKEGSDALRYAKQYGIIYRKYS